MCVITYLWKTNFVYLFGKFKKTITINHYILFSKYSRRSYC